MRVGDWDAVPSSGSSLFILFIYSGYLLVLEVCLHATLFVQVESVVTVRIVLGKDGFNLRIGIATPTNAIVMPDTQGYAIGGGVLASST